MRNSIERTRDRLYHEVGLPADVEALRPSFRRFAEDEVAPRVADMEDRTEEVASFPAYLFHRMGELGFYRIPFPAAEGGMGLAHPMLSAALLMEELAYFSNSIAVIYVCQSLFSGRILQYAAPELKAAYLPGLLSGEKVACGAITEPGAGSDLGPQSVTTVATPVAGGWSLTGRKRFIINAPVADFACVLCSMEGALSMLAVDLKQRGVTVPPPDRKLGMHACLTSDILFENVYVPSDRLIGQRGKGLRIALGALTRGRIAASASGFGMAQASFDESVHWMKERSMFGKRLADMQHWQYRLAERATQIAMARDLCFKAALRHDAGEEFPEPETSMAKYYGTQAGVDMARDAVQILGAYGYTSQLGADGARYRVEQLFRDSKGPEIYEGSNEVLKWVIARQMFGRQG